MLINDCLIRWNSVKPIDFFFLQNRLDVLEDLPPSVGTVCKSIMKVEPSERPESHEVIKYPELRIWMRKYYRGLDDEDREIVKLQLFDVIDCDDN